MNANPKLSPPVPATPAYRFFNPKTGRYVRIARDINEAIKPFNDWVAAQSR